MAREKGATPSRGGRVIREVCTAAFATILGFAAPVWADPTACETDLVKQSASYSRVVWQSLAQCEGQVLNGGLQTQTDCRTDASTTAFIAGAAARAAVAIARRCCGPDEICGTADDPAPASFGWTTGACPDLFTHGCTNAITDPGAIGTCLTCSGHAGGDVGFELLEGQFAGAAPGSSLARCQAAIDRAATKLFQTGAKALATCWQARLAGKHTNPCPVPGDGKAGPTLAKAEAKAMASICQACGGADGACGGGDDLEPAAIGFLPTCPALTVPGGASCAHAVATLADLATCAACVTEFALQCGARLAVPEFEAYPAAECNPPAPACVTGVECTTSLDCPSGYTCTDNLARTRYCVGQPCAADADCGGGGVCRPYCTTARCDGQRCQCPGFACTGSDVLCIDSGGLACRKICTSDADCVAPFGGVCVNATFNVGLCIGTTACH